MPSLIYALEIAPPSIITVSPEDGGREILLGGLSGIPDGIVVDPRSQTIFWTNMGRHGRTAEGEDDFSAADGTIECCAMDGTERRTLVSGGAVVTPKQLILDRDGAKLYWCDREGMRVMRCDLDGGHIETLVRTGLYPADSNDSERHCVGIALDMRNRQLYWTQKGPADGGKGRIFRAGLEIPPGDTPDSRSDIELLFENLPEPIDLEIDPVGRVLYWTDRGNLPGGNSLNRCNLDCDAPRTYEMVADGLQEGIGLALDHAGNRAFVSDLSGAIRVAGLQIPSRFETIAKFGPVTDIALPLTE